MTHPTRLTYCPFFLALLLLLLVGCVTSKSLEPEEPTTLTKIAVLPSDIIDEDGKTSIASNQLLEKGANILDGLIAQYLATKEGIIFLSKEQQETLLTEYNQNRSVQALYIAKKSGADAVLTSMVNRYQERAGQDYSIDYPASISFEYRLVLEETGQTLCAGFFDETQQSITENILSFKKTLKRGGKWITTEELAREGVEEKFKACRFLRK